MTKQAYYSKAPSAMWGFYSVIEYSRGEEMCKAVGRGNIFEVHATLFELYVFNITFHMPGNEILSSIFVVRTPHQIESESNHLLFMNIHHIL